MLLPVRRRPDALLQLHQPGHVGGDELVFDSRRRGPVVAVVVAVHQHGLGLADQRHLEADGVTGRELGKGKSMLKRSWTPNKFYNSNFSKLQIKKVILTSIRKEAQSKTHPIALLHEVLPADMCHDACGQSIPHDVHHGAESVSVEEEDI